MVRCHRRGRWFPVSAGGANSLIFRARAFEFHARHLWRFHRRVVRRHLSPRCVKCSVSAAFSPLDARGVCRECRDLETAVAGSKGATSNAPPDHLAGELDALLDAHQGAGAGLYDALVMLSGGKDSALLVHELCERYPKLRLLALTVDNGFMSPVALQNAALTAEKLNVDYLLLRPAPTLFRKSFRFACTHFEPGKGAFETVDRIDADLGISLARIHAAANRIPLLLTGLSWAQIERLFRVHSFEIPADQALARVTQTLGRDLSDIYDASELQYWWDPARFPKEAWPRFIHPFYVWRFEEAEIQRRVVELGLIKAGNDSPLLTNNILIPMMIMSDYHHLGYASFEPEFASMVREGKADRIFWRNVFEMLEYSARTGWMLDKEVDKIAASLGLDRRDIGLPVR